MHSNESSADEASDRAWIIREFFIFLGVCAIVMAVDYYILRNHSYELFYFLLACSIILVILLGRRISCYLRNEAPDRCAVAPVRDAEEVEKDGA